VVDVSLVKGIRISLKERVATAQTGVLCRSSWRRPRRDRPVGVHADRPVADRRGRHPGARLSRPLRARHAQHPGRRTRGEIAFALQTSLDLAYGRCDISFDWAGFDEMDELTGSGSAELLDDGSLEIEFDYQHGDEAILKAERATSSAAC
jgi:hypothetical protein